MNQSLKQKILPIGPARAKQVRTGNVFLSESVILFWFRGILEKLITAPLGWQSAISSKLTWASSVCKTYSKSQEEFLTVFSFKTNSDFTKFSFEIHKIFNTQAVCGNALKRGIDTLILNWGILTPYWILSPLNSLPYAYQSYSLLQTMPIISLEWVKRSGSEISRVKFKNFKSLRGQS